MKNQWVKLHPYNLKRLLNNTLDMVYGKVSNSSIFERIGNFPMQASDENPIWRRRVRIHLFTVHGLETIIRHYSCDCNFYDFVLAVKVHLFFP